MPRAFVGVGANLEPERHVREALRRLAARHPIVAVSTFYRTRPEDRPEQPDFVNGVVELDASAQPERLRADLRGIEQALGRVRTGDKGAARPIDLDLLFYGALALDGSISRRAFLAVPLAELAPDLRLSLAAAPLREVARALSGQPMTALPGLTAELRGLVAEARRAP